MRSFQMSSQAHNEDSFHSLASVLVRHLRALPSLTILCPHCDTSHTTGIVELALLVAPQLKAFEAGLHSFTGTEASAPQDSNVNGIKGSAPAPPCNAQCPGTEAPTDSILIASKEPAVASPPSIAEAEETVKKSGVRGSPEKDETLLLASVRNTTAPSICDVKGAGKSNGSATESVFKVKRKSKSGEALELRLSDVSPLFSLHLPKAAKELGTSTTSLKKACRFFGLHRWPGRKVRGLESTIDGLERTLVGQGADSEVTGMRSEIPKLQQELDELCYGTLAQISKKMHSPAVITTNAYRRLYYVHGWRSEHHNLGRHDISTGSQPNLTSGLAPLSAPEISTEANGEAKAKKQPKRKQKPAPCTDDPPAKQPTPNADKESPRPSPRPRPRKYIRSGPRRILRSSTRLGSRDTEMKASDLEGLLPEVHDTNNVAGREVPESVVQAQNGNNMLTSKTKIGEEGTGDGKVAVEEGATVAEQSVKRPKTEPRCWKCGKCC